MPRRMRELGVTLIWSTAIAALIPIAMWMFRPDTPAKALLFQFLFAGVYSNFAGTTFHLGTSWVWPITKRLNPLGAVFARALAFVGFATVSSLAAAALISPIVNWKFSQVFWDGYRVTLLISLSLGAAISAYHAVKHELVATQLELKKQELERERAQKLATESQLASLESRIHPHFLFNALNSISSLIPDDPKRAERLLGQIAALLRFSLDTPQLGLVPLDRELRITEDYLEIEKARFDGRLRFEIEREGNLTSVAVPPLSIQTLAENAVKYAVGPSRDGASIRIHVGADNGNARIEVTDDGPGFDPSAILAGHGLDTLNRRLEVLYPGHAGLEIHREKAAMRVGFSVPFRAAATAVRNSAA